MPNRTTPLGRQAFVLHGFALPCLPRLLPALAAVVAQTPFRHMQTRSGAMSVAMSNCGALGWTSDRRGYRYTAHDPDSGLPWPLMPDVFLQLARDAAATAGFDAFAPDACLVNRYLPGTRLSLHQDRDERDREAPIVSVSLGLPATFQWGGDARSDKVVRVPLEHGDVVVWGGVDRMRYHGVSPLKDGLPSPLGAERVNLTFRKALS